jgi:hypothetical protein
MNHWIKSLSSWFILSVCGMIAYLGPSHMVMGDHFLLTMYEKNDFRACLANPNGDFNMTLEHDGCHEFIGEIPEHNIPTCYYKVIEQNPGTANNATEIVVLSRCDCESVVDMRSRVMFNRTCYRGRIEKNCGSLSMQHMKRVIRLFLNNTKTMSHWGYDLVSP